jgi:hypothetical protein
MYTVSFPFTRSKSAMHPQVSIDATWIRGMYRSCFTVTSASANAFSVAARSPASQWKMRLSFLSFLSVRRTGASGASALNGSTTTGSGS